MKGSDKSPFEADSYKVWHIEEQGKLPYVACHALMSSMTSGWTRRCCTLLELGCAEGYFLESFWYSGFDATGQEQDLSLAAIAQERLDGRAEILHNTAVAMPFEDKHFDYVVCMDTGKFADTGGLIAEACRLASRSVAFGFRNRFSLPGAVDKLKHANSTYLNPFTFWRCIRKQDRESRLSLRSNLIGPAWSWQGRRLDAAINLASFRLPIGGYAIFRMDFQPSLGGMVWPLLLDKARGGRRFAAGSMGQAVN